MIPSIRQLAAHLCLTVAAATLLASCAGPAGDLSAPSSAGKAITVSAPSHWRVLAMQPELPLAGAAFRIPNPADEGTSDSTTVAVMGYAADSKIAQRLFRKTKQKLPKTGLSKSQRAGWEIEDYQDNQAATRYRNLYGTKVLADRTLFVRVAWPLVPRNAPGYDAQMLQVFHRLLAEVH